MTEKIIAVSGIVKEWVFVGVILAWLPFLTIRHFDLEKEVTMKYSKLDYISEGIDEIKGDFKILKSDVSKLKTDVAILKGKVK